MPRQRKRKIGGNRKVMQIPRDTDDSDLDLPSIVSLPKIRRALSGLNTDCSDKHELHDDLQGQPGLSETEQNNHSEPSNNDLEDVQHENTIDIDNNVKDVQYDSSSAALSNAFSDESSVESLVSDNDIVNNLEACTAGFEEYFVRENDDSNFSEDEFEDIFVPENDDYLTILKQLSKDWLLTEIGHEVSKVCSDKFWAIAMKGMHLLYVSKERQKIKRKVPQFTQIRKKMYDDHSPKVEMQVAFKEKTTGNITVVNDSKTPLGNYPATQFKKIYEIASVDVIINH